MPKPTNEKKMLLRIGTRPFLEAQNFCCPLCGVNEWQPKPEPNGMKGFEKNYPNLPYFAETWDHVVPEAKGGPLFGNTLVVHYGCNARKAKALPLPHEVAILKVVNEKLGWDGITYTKTPVGRKLYEHMQRVMDHAGLLHLLTICHDPMMLRNFLMWRNGLTPTTPPPIEAKPWTVYYPPRRGHKPSKGLLLVERGKYDHMLIAGLR